MIHIWDTAAELAKLASAHEGAWIELTRTGLLLRFRRMTKKTKNIIGLERLVPYETLSSYAEPLLLVRDELNRMATEVAKEMEYKDAQA